MKNKIKSKILHADWNRYAYHSLSQIVVLLDVDEAFELYQSAFKAFKRNQKFDTLSLQFICLASINFLNCCYHQNAEQKYIEPVIEFLRTLPVDPVIGFYQVLATYYETLFAQDLEKLKWITLVIKQSGYLSTIVDTLPEEIKNELKK
ncbi:hypothetical protein FP432_00910 [Lactobacillus sp. PV034]|nr:hypothetical protein FP432_00910 [Lactobacillus sp. PV034]